MKHQTHWQFWAAFAAACAVCVVAGAALAACQPNCSAGCKAHDRWCTLNRIFDRPVVIKDACSEQPDNGTPVENDTVSWQTYESCKQDCEGDANSTGAPVGDIVDIGQSVYKTRCAS